MLVVGWWVVVGCLFGLDEVACCYFDCVLMAFLWCCLFVMGFLLFGLWLFLFAYFVCVLL